MQRTWYRRLFLSAHDRDLKSTEVKARQGDADSQFALGLKCGNASGQLQDLTQAAEWYRQAAEQDHCLAQFNLGLMYAKGQGVPQDDDKARAWIQRAAQGGDAGAQFDLGARCHRASLNGLQADRMESRIEAYKWFHLAAAQGYKNSAASCERVALGMTREEVTEGNHRVAAFVPANLKPEQVAS
jgi:TPR repeat protein